MKSKPLLNSSSIIPHSSFIFGDFMNIHARINPEITRALRLTLPTRRALFAAALVIGLSLAGVALSVNRQADRYQRNWNEIAEMESNIKELKLRLNSAYHRNEDIRVPHGAQTIL